LPVARWLLRIYCITSHDLDDEAENTVCKIPQDHIDWISEVTLGVWLALYLLRQRCAFLENGIGSSGRLTNGSQPAFSSPRASFVEDGRERRGKEFVGGANTRLCLSTAKALNDGSVFLPADETRNCMTQHGTDRYRYRSLHNSHVVFKCETVSNYSKQFLIIRIIEPWILILFMLLLSLVLNNDPYNKLNCYSNNNNVKLMKLFQQFYLLVVL